MKMVALGDVADINPKAEKVAPDEEVSFVGMADLDIASALTQSTTVRPFREVSKGYTTFADGDILVAKITPCFENNKIGQAQLSCKIGVGSTEFHVVRPSERLHDRYLLHFLRQDRVRRAGERRMTGSAGQRRVPVNFIEGLRVPLPSLDEQRRIAAILDHADALRGKRLQVLSLLDSLEQATFLELFGSPATWPERWSMGTIGEMADDVQYGTASKAGDDGAWPIIRMGNVTDSGRLDLTDLKWIDLSEPEVARFTVRRGDLLFNRTNSREKVGKTCVIETDEPLAFAGYLVRVRLKSDHQPAFVNAYMTSSYGRALRFGMAKAAVNQANINATEMRTIRIAIPPAELQKKFAEQIAKIGSEREKQQQAAAGLDELFLSLQYRAFTGQL